MNDVVFALAHALQPQQRKHSAEEELANEVVAWFSLWSQWLDVMSFSSSIVSLAQSLFGNNEFHLSMSWL